ncbi:hypothetical protein OEZ86_010353 [Tetradesmus obliquus]|nr:hypothetical protein OEZ86_010353 [Tetradesmus obliquus]
MADALPGVFFETTATLSSTPALTIHALAEPGSDGICTAEPAPDTSYSCGCTAGYSWTGGACQDTNGCAGNPCARTANSDGTRTDVRAPGNGYTCRCVTGAFWANGACQDVNGCQGSPCDGKSNTISGSCVDARAPGIGYSCACDTGYAWKGNTDGTGLCQDDDECTDGFLAGFKCEVLKQLGRSNGTCYDNPAPKTGYTCACNADLIWDDSEQTCKGTFCAAQPCAPNKVSNSAGNCIELSYPGSGFACGCKTGYWWNGNACSPSAGTCVHVFAGITGLFGYSGDGGPASAALFTSPNAVAVDADGNVYIADTSNTAIRKAVASREGTLSAKVYSFEPDLSAVTVAAQLVPAIYPRGIAFNSAGDTLIGAYFGSYSGVLQWAKSSALEAWIQVSSATTTADDGVAATTAKLSAFALAVDANGNMLVSDVELDSYFQAVRCAVWLVDAGTGKLKRVAGTLGPCGSTVDPNNPGNTKIGRSGGVAFDPSGNWAYIADPDNQRILKIDLKCGSK